MSIVIATALAEDAPWGDVTSEALIPAASQITAAFVAREAGVFCGAGIIAATFAAIDTLVEVDEQQADGQSFAEGDVLATVHGSARSVLRGERVVLNLLQHSCAIATITATYVAAVSHLNARVIDTRKTTAGLRALEKYAVRCGGGGNHRFSLSDAAMVKDNHLGALFAAGLDITAALREARKRLPHTTHLEVEVDRLDQLLDVLAAEPDSVLLDNFTIDQLREGVALVAGRVPVVASGGVNLQSVASIAETGVDFISVGALTNGVGAIDIGLDVKMRV